MAENRENRIEFEQAWIRRVIGDVPTKEIKIENGCKPGVNFVSIVERWHISLESHNENEKTNMTMIVKKCPPQNSIQCRLMDCGTMFNNEVVAYKEIIPLLGVEHMFPKCLDAMPDRIVLDDLSAQTFQLPDCKNGLNEQELLLSIKALSEFHSSSFRLKKSSPAVWSRIRSLPVEAIFRPGNTAEILWKNSLWCGVESLRTSDDKVLVRAAEIIKPKADLKTLRQLTELKRDAFAVISHGDLWGNNLMFRYDVDKRAESVRLLDLQAVRHTTCALDICHLLCANAQRGALLTDFDRLLQSYYRALGQFVGQAPFTYAELQEEIRRTSLFGVLLGFMMIPCATRDPDDTENDSVEEMTQDSDERRLRNFRTWGTACHQRIRSMVSDLINLGYFNPSSI